MKLARARREAVFGDPIKALEIVYGRDTARGMMYSIPKERFETRADAERHLRRALSNACTVCGARWSERCDAGLHS